MAKTFQDVSNKEKNKQTGIKDALASIEKQFGKGSILRIGDGQIPEIPKWETSILSFDRAIGGGLPKGRIIEIFGLPSSGKSSTVLSWIADIQRQGGTAAYIDMEFALDLQYAKKLGVNVNDLIIASPSCGEDALEMVDTLVKSGSIDFIAVDSVATLVPRAELEGEMGDASISLQARMMSKAMRKLTGSISTSQTIVTFINQVRMRIGGYGNPSVTSGGLGLSFAASVRIEVLKGETKKRGDEVIGNRPRYKFVKNKVASPYSQSEVDFYFSIGFDKESSVIEEALKAGVIEKSGTWYSYKDTKLGQGMANASEYLRSRAELKNEIEREIRKAWKDSDKLSEIQEASRFEQLPDNVKIDMETGEIIEGDIDPVAPEAIQTLKKHSTIEDLSASISLDDKVKEDSESPLDSSPDESKNEGRKRKR